VIGCQSPRTSRSRGPFAGFLPLDCCWRGHGCSSVSCPSGCDTRMGNRLLSCLLCPREHDCDGPDGYVGDDGNGTAVGSAFVMTPGRSGSSSGQGISAWTTAASSFATLIPRPFLTYTLHCRSISRRSWIRSRRHASNVSCSNVRSLERISPTRCRFSTCVPRTYLSST